MVTQGADFEQIVLEQEEHNQSDLERRISHEEASGK